MSSLHQSKWNRVEENPRVVVTSPLKGSHVVGAGNLHPSTFGYNVGGYQATSNLGPRSYASPLRTSGLVQGGLPPQLGYQSGIVHSGFQTGLIQNPVQNITYEQVPVRTVEYQTVPVQTIDYQTVPVAAPVQVSQMRESIKGESYLEYVPFEKSYFEQVPVERIEYVPVEKKYTDYYAVEKQVEYVPFSRYETVREMVPQQRTEYVAQTKVEYVPQTRTEMVPVQRIVEELVAQDVTEYVPQTRVEQIPQVRTEMIPVDRQVEKVDYQAQERTIVHYPEVDRQFVLEAERSGRIRTDLSGGLVGGSSFVGGGLVGGGSLVSSGARAGFVGGSVIGGAPYGGNVVRSGFAGPSNLGARSFGSPVIGGGSRLATSQFVGSPVHGRQVGGGVYTSGAVFGGNDRIINRLERSVREGKSNQKNFKKGGKK